MATLQELLAALSQNGPGLPAPAPSAPIPYAPIPNLGPLSDQTTAALAAQNPEPVPPQINQPAAPDMSFVNQYAGPAPTAPAPLSRGQRIANAVMGFGAGVQGYGPQFLSQLQEPQRAYQQQLERYQGQRAQGLELAERRAEREAEQANRLNEQTYEREFRTWLSKNNDRSDEAKQRMAHLFTLQRDARAAQIAEETQQRRERAQQERDARTLSGRAAAVGAAPAIAKEIGLYYAGLSDSLSPGAAKFESARARLQEAQTLRAQSAAARAVANMDAAKAAVVSAVQRGDVRSERLLRRKLDAAVGNLARFPGQIEYGGGEWPWAKLVTTQGNGGLAGGQPGQPQGASPARAQAKSKLMAAGYSDVEAEQELNRLGIK